MKRSVLLAISVAFAILLGSLALWARPASIKCPIDGEYMFFDHQVGFGDDAVCWYTHNHTDYDAEGAHRVRHDAYVPCGD